MRTNVQPLAHLLICFRWFVVAVFLVALFSGVSHASLIFPSLTSPIREKMESVEAELAALPVFPMNKSPWTMGYSTAQHEEPQMPVRIAISFPQTAVIDLVALMPSSFTDQRNKVQSWGFPVRFMIERVLPDGSTDIIADYRDKDYPIPGIAPQFFPCPNPVPASGLRITVTEAAANDTWWRAPHIVSFSELYAFSGERNVALNAEVKATSSNEFGFMWSTKCLTDGFTLFSPLFHDVEDPENNIVGHGLKELQLEIDLGEVHRIDEFHLWPVVHAIQHNFPPSSGMGFPLSIRLESSQFKDFSNSKVIYESDNLIYRPGAGPFMHQTQPTEGRFLKLRLSKGFPDFMRNPPQHLARISLSEIEILGNGKNLSRGVSIHVQKLSEEDKNRVVSLTDGRSNEGQILPLRQWLDQFKRRVQLEAKLRSLRDQLDEAQRLEDRRSRTILLVAIGCILILIQIIWLVRVAARRRAARMRERIACDLHDEIGANVSSMAHTTELLAESINQPSQAQSRLLGNLVENARLTYRETKHFIRFIEGENHSHDIAQQLTQVADQILGTIPSVFSLENTRSFNALNPAAKWNLLLFYKEALNNIIKHAEASEVKIATSRQDRQLRLQVVDNGRGFSQESTSCRRLEERATMLRGKLEIDSRPEQGASITIYFKSA